MYLTGGDSLAVEVKIPGGTGIVSYRAGESKIKGSPDCGIHTHARHHPAKEKAVHSGTPNTLQQVGIAETVGKVFRDDRLLR